MPEPKTNEAAAFVISAKMAKALADTWRSRILMELSIRPLSPSQFVEEVGGELEHIGRCFRKLAEWDYIELIDVRPDRRGGAAVEHVYRRIQRAHFDTSTWEDLPRVHRDAFSGSLVGSYITRISQAIEAQTFDDELNRHLSWDTIPLDRIAWTQLVTHLDEVLDWIPRLAAEAVARITKSGEEPIATTVGLAAFRSPESVVVGTSPPRQQREPAPSQAMPFIISAKMAKALANKWRARILMELRVRPMSPTQFTREIGGSQGHISRCFRELAGWDYIELIETRRGDRKRRGGAEKIYRTKQRAHFDTRTWEELPRFLRDEFSASILHSYFGRVAEAIRAGTFDSEVDRHFSWDGVALDRIAWTELITCLDETLAWLAVLEEEAAQRMAQTGEEPIPTTVGLAAFSSPKTSQFPPVGQIRPK
ncbi:MAG TPA: winged helix-turn-helix domain-containing protein [Solirubrobacterales bacterium]|nr:winged helix-turn-helix domain-containing protein [Solirubrobacterales bacterium]